MKKLIFVTMVVLSICTGCNEGNVKKSETDAMIKPIEVNSIEVETIEVEHILVETIIH